MSTLRTGRRRPDRQPLAAADPAQQLCTDPAVGSRLRPDRLWPSRPTARSAIRPHLLPASPGGTLRMLRTDYARWPKRVGAT